MKHLLLSWQAWALLSAGFAALLAWGWGLHPATALLATSPGGMAEMSLVALGLGVEVAIVASMHIFRIAVVVIAVPPVFKLLGLKKPG